MSTRFLVGPGDEDALVSGLCPAAVLSPAACRQTAAFALSVMTVRAVMHYGAVAGRSSPNVNTACST
jgi:hypothetical protein